MSLAVIAPRHCHAAPVGALSWPACPSLLQTERGDFAYCADFTVDVRMPVDFN